MAENKNEYTVTTTHRKISLCQITSGKISTLAPITHIAFGDGGLDGDNSPLVPLETQTKLNNELARFPIDSVSYPEDTTAEYTVTIPEGELGGKYISEAALVDSDDKLCCIQNMLGKGKDEQSSFIFTFHDKFN